MTLPTGSPPQFNFEDLARGGSLRQFDDHAALLASTDAAEGAGSLWFARGLPYREAASDATDHDYTTAGGVKLYAPVFGDDASTGFFSNGANPVAKLEWYGRVALGDAGDHNLATDGNVTGGGWPQSFTALNPAGGTQVIEGWDYAEDQSLVFGTTSGRGTIGIASQTEGGDGAVYTLKAFHNNNRDAGQKGGAVYIDAIYNDAAAGDTITQEANLANLVGPVAAPTPYTETAGEILNILRLGAGSDAEIFGPSYAIGAFIHAIDNGAKAHCGLLFEHNALLRDDQPDTPGVANGLGFARAVQTAYNVGYSWLSRDPVSTPGTQAEVVKLTSLVVDPTVKWRTEWTDTAFVVGEDVDPDSNLFVVNYNGTAGTGVSVTPSVAGGSPKIAAIGTNANINLEIDGKGTGDVYTPLGTSLGVGTPTPEYALDVNGSLGFTPGASVDPVNNGDVVFEATDNNTITLKHRGSDGTVRDLGLPLDQVLSTAPQPFESRAELVTWWAANSASVLAGEVLADGSVEYLKMPAGHALFGTDPIADLPGLVPFGDWDSQHLNGRSAFEVLELAAPAIPYRPRDGVLSTNLIGTTSEIASDFEGRFLEALEYCEGKDVTLHVQRPNDGTPFDYQYIDRTITGDLSLRFDRDAIFYPRVDFEDFATGGSTGPFTITAWPYDGTGLSGMLVDGSTETKIVEGTDFTTALVGDDYQVTLTSTPSATATLRVCARRAALSLRAVPSNNYLVEMDGYMSIDGSRSGYAISSGTRSGLSINTVNRFIQRGTIHAYGTEASDWTQAPLDRRFDSGLVLLGVQYADIDHVLAEYVNDLAVYSTGGADGASESDDGGYLRIGRIGANRCASGTKFVRGNRGIHVGYLSAKECQTGFIHGDTGGLVPGRGIHIGRIFGEKIGRRFIDVRDTVGEVTIGSAGLIDIGYEPDGVTPIGLSGPAGVFLTSASGVSIQHFDARFKNWTAPSGLPAIQMSGDGNYGNRVEGGYIDGFDEGYTETGGTTNETGNSIRATLKDVTTPISLEANSKTRVEMVSITETGGSVTSQRIEAAGAWEDLGGITVGFAGVSTDAAASYVTQTFFVEQTGRTLNVSGEINASSVSNPGGTQQIRFTMPVTSGRSGVGNDLFTITSLAGLNPPAGTTRLIGEVPPGTNYMRIRYEGSASGILNASHHTGGTTIRIGFSGTLEVAP